MPLLIHNTLTGQREEFHPLNPPLVRMYVCGVTVYDYCHIGHARAYVNFDCIRRYLLHLGYEVTYVQNFTDVDDKIIARSTEQHISPTQLTERFIAAFFEDMDSLGVLRASVYPRATDYIPHMQQMITTLIQKGDAYVVDGDVFYAIHRFISYGKLSKKILEDLESGKRVDPSEKKQDPMDFALWKAAKPGEPAWDSPWGPGRPGWHIECSAMALDTLGATLDIHGGGEDLIFPHHENEICQSESATGHPLSRYWIHNGFVTIKNEKMSKSKQNFFTIRDVLSKFSGDTIRFFLLKVHYRSPLHFSFDGLVESEQALKKLRATLMAHPDTAVPDTHRVEFDTRERAFHDLILDDFNFPGSIGILFDLYHLVVRLDGGGSSVLRRCMKILGFFDTLPVESVDTPPDDVLKLAEARHTAKAAKEFQLADTIRDQIRSLGWILEDTKDGFRWKKGS